MYKLLKLLMNFYKDTVQGNGLNYHFKFTVKSSDIIPLLKLLVEHSYQ